LIVGLDLGPSYSIRIRRRAFSKSLGIQY
jgi:hypothetical protein